MNEEEFNWVIEQTLFAKLQAIKWFLDDGGGMQSAPQTHLNLKDFLEEI
jgi:hypothetical protein